jgi:hypothetical protein
MNAQFMNSYTGQPYMVVMNAAMQEAMPMLAQNDQKNPRKANKNDNMMFFVFSKISMVLGLAALVIAIIALSIVMFKDDFTRRTYETTTFLTTIDRDSIDSWQVLTQPWSMLSKANPTHDVQFNHYFECWHMAKIAWTQCDNATVADYKTCINTKYSTQLGVCANSSEPNSNSPSMNGYAQCVNNFLHPSRKSLNAFKICLRTNVWPLYEEPQSIDSWYLLGSFNWMTLFAFGFALFACFVVYTAGVWSEESMNASVEEVPTSAGPLGKGVASFCAAATLLFLIYFLVNAYRLQDNSALGTTNVYPNSAATNMIMMPVTMLVFAYFAAELLTMFVNTKTYNDIRTKYFPVNNTSQQSMLEAHHMPHARMPKASHVREIVNKYFPALTLIWTDAYLIDAVILIGILGATQQISTSLLYQIFITALIYRILKTATARFVYEGYIKNPDEKRVSKGKANKTTNVEIFAVRLQATFLYIAGFITIIMLYFLLSNTNTMISEFQLVQMFFLFGYFIPELIRIIAYIYISSQSDPVMAETVILNVEYFVWIWDVTLRLIYVIIICWGYDTIGGTQNFLATRLNNITSTITYMNAY